MGKFTRVQFKTRAALRKYSMHPKYDMTGVRIHDFWIMNRTFHTLETLVLTTEPSRTSIIACRDVMSVSL